MFVSGYVFVRGLWCCEAVDRVMAMLFIEYLDCFFNPSFGQMLNTVRYYKKFIHLVTISVTYLAQHKKVLW